MTFYCVCESVQEKAGRLNFIKIHHLKPFFFFYGGNFTKRESLQVAEVKEIVKIMVYLEIYHYLLQLPTHFLHFLYIFHVVIVKTHFIQFSPLLSLG